MSIERKAIPSYKAIIERYGTPISDDDFNRLRDYANECQIKLSGFR